MAAGTKRGVRDGFNIYPMPVAIVGTVTDGRPNFMTVAWVVKLQGDPPLVGVVIGRGQHTAKGIQQTGEFSVSFPSREQAALADYCGLYSGRRENKAARIDIFRGDLESAPMVGQCPLTMECRLRQTVELGGFLFIGEVVNVFAEEAVLSEGSVDPRKLQPIVFTQPDKMYWALGDPVGQAWKIGEVFHQED
ncbi:MAG: flavin reductase family protein [Actinobacteria bacterium]|jgi:flavin reductase (DIM6/NTAB) family NADH-FMN oxidoreductase RutF|nr:flavin reductase family protein [Actinomycetota bacterium]